MGRGGVVAGCGVCQTGGNTAQVAGGQADVFDALGDVAEGCAVGVGTGLPGRGWAE